MAIEPPSVRERRLAAELRRARQAAALNGQQVAAATGWSASKVSRIENGRIGISPDDLDRLLALYGVAPDAATQLRRLAPDGRAHGWWEAYADSLSTGYATLLRLEAGSTVLRTYCALIPHPLLMTPDYIRQVVRSTWQRPSVGEVERRVQVCLRRQAVLGRGDSGRGDGSGSLRMSVVLDEAVLRRSAGAVAGPAGSEDQGLGRDGRADPGGPAPSPDPATIRRGQLRHLLSAAAGPSGPIRILPFAAGIPPVSAGSFSVLESAATGAADLVYLENKTRISFVDGEEEVDRYARDHRLLVEMALSPADSADLLADVVRTG